MLFLIIVLAIVVYFIGFGAYVKWLTATRQEVLDRTVNVNRSRHDQKVFDIWDGWFAAAAAWPIAIVIRTLYLMGERVADRVMRPKIIPEKEYDSTSYRTAEEKR